MTDGGSSAQRIRIGLTGLAFAFLIVLLGSAISRSSEQAEPDSTGAEQVLANEAEDDEAPDEPLARLGVAPGAEAAANRAANRAAAVRESGEAAANRAANRAAAERGSNEAAPGSSE